jgi:hypothetical protein
MTTYSYTTLSDPSAAPGGFTSPVSINDSGQVTGSYFNGNAQVGFFYSNGTWTTLNDPSAGANGFTFPVSINDRGQIIGSTPTASSHSKALSTATAPTPP